MPLIVVLFILVLSYLQPVGAYNASHVNHTTGQAKNGTVQEDMFDDITGVRTFRPENAIKPRIIGGREAWAHSWPWQVSLRFGNVHACGGAIISAQWVVSAAHCFITHSTPSFWTVMAGKHDLDNPKEACQQFREVAVIIGHNRYHRLKKVNDIALVKLTIPFTFNECVRPINILTGPLPVEHKCTITGWGSTTENGPKVSRLQEVNVTILHTQTCNSFYHGMVASEMFCAGDLAGGVDACQGDSGGPLCCFRGRYELAGIVSWGVGCGRVQKPGVYTRLQLYKDWINTEMQSYMESGGAVEYKSLAPCGQAVTGPCKLSKTSAKVVERGQDGPRVLNVSTACPYSWPWQLSLQSKGQHYCSGTLISHDWVLAPRDCHSNTKSDVVALGVHDLTFMATQTVPLAEVISIEGARGFPPELDLSLIRLSAPARVGSTISPVCLHHNDDEPDESWPCITTGWGSTDAIRGVNPNILHQARINIVNMASCRAAWGQELIGNSHICASPAGSKACMGDPGAPLLCERHEKYYLVGMATWSGKTCDPKKPAVFTRVSEFQSWITENVIKI